MAHAAIVTPSSAVACDGWSASWLFNNNALDQTGGYDLTVHGTPVYGTTPTPPEGSHFINLNAVGRYLTREAISLGDTFTLGFEIWHPTGDIKTVFYNLNGSNNGIWVYLDVPNDDIIVYCNNGSVNNGTALDCSIPIEEFYSLIITFDRDVGSYGEVGIFLNGVDVTTDSEIAQNFGNNYAVSIGGTSGGNLLFGYLDAAFWYDRILTGTEITNIVTTPGQQQCAE